MDPEKSVGFEHPLHVGELDPNFLSGSSGAEHTELPPGLHVDQFLQIHRADHTVRFRLKAEPAILPPLQLQQQVLTQLVDLL